MNNNNLPLKFLPFLLGHSSCLYSKAAVLKQDIDSKLKTRTTVNIKENYILDAGKWILKLPRTGINTTPDTHIYRIRKAEKIRNFIKVNHLEEHLKVPKKFLYESKNGEYFVAAKKVDLSNEVASVSDISFKNNISSFTLGGQCKAFNEGASQRDLTPTQAKALAELAFLGYTDQSYNNVFFTKTGKVAILDTEPVKRVMKKTVVSSNFFMLLIDKQTLLATQAITGTAKLKAYCTNPEALRQVEIVERKHVLWNVAKLILKIAVCCLVIYYIPVLIASSTLPVIVATALKVSLIAVLSIKTCTLTTNLANLLLTWKHSCNGFAGLTNIVRTEQQGLL
jgi:hypothetical protein